MDRMKSLTKTLKNSLGLAYLDVFSTGEELGFQVRPNEAHKLIEHFSSTNKDFEMDHEDGYSFFFIPLS